MALPLETNKGGARVVDDRSAGVGEELPAVLCTVPSLVRQGHSGIPALPRALYSTAALWGVRKQEKLTMQREQGPMKMGHLDHGCAGEIESKALSFARQTTNRRVADKGFPMMKSAVKSTSRCEGHQSRRMLSNLGDVVSVPPRNNVSSAVRRAELSLFTKYQFVQRRKVRCDDRVHSYQMTGTIACASCRGHGCSCLPFRCLVPTAERLHERARVSVMCLWSRQTRQLDIAGMFSVSFVVSVILTWLTCFGALGNRNHPPHFALLVLLQYCRSPPYAVAHFSHAYYIKRVQL